jgi:hypothetical protein
MNDSGNGEMLGTLMPQRAQCAGSVALGVSKAWTDMRMPF